jgi:hypothetical protein
MLLFASSASVTLPQKSARQHDIFIFFVWKGKKIAKICIISQSIILLKVRELFLI